MIALISLFLILLPSGCSQKTEFIRIPPNPALTQNNPVPVLRKKPTWDDVAAAAKQCETELKKCNADKTGLRGEPVE
jgi:hypothetical protein